jgi:hypothetical protein
MGEVSDQRLREIAASADGTGRLPATMVRVFAANLIIVELLPNVNCGDTGFFGVPKTHKGQNLGEFGTFSGEFFPR